MKPIYVCPKGTDTCEQVSYNLQICLYFRCEYSQYIKFENFEEITPFLRVLRLGNSVPIHSLPVFDSILITPFA